MSKIVALLTAWLFCVSAFAGDNGWTPNGPPGTSAQAVRYLPGTGRVAISITPVAIFRTTDDGAHWATVQKFPAHMQHEMRGTVGVNPQNGNQVLVAAD